jgi:hypothetical protein
VSVDSGKFTASTELPESAGRATDPGSRCSDVVEEECIAGATDEGEVDMRIAVEGTEEKRVS